MKPPTATPLCTTNLPAKPHKKARNQLVFTERIGHVLLAIPFLSGCLGSNSDSSHDNALNLCGISTTVNEMVEKLNAARSTTRTCGSTSFPATTPVNWSERLAQAAEGHSAYMANNNVFSHTGLGGSTVGTRIQSTGYAYTTAGENIAAEQPNVDSVINDWLASPGHCANIMNPAFKEYGFACVFNSTSTYQRYWTQVFAAPR